MSDVEWVTKEDCRNRIAELETEAGKTADELRVMRKTWDMTVRQRDILNQIEDYEWLMGEDVP
jgi:hypothetical protein